MARGSWKEIHQVFASALSHNEYGTLADKMLVLSKHLEKNLDLKGMVQGTSLLTLTFLLPDSSNSLHVIWEHDDVYKLYAYGNEGIVQSPRLIRLSQAVRAIDEYRQQFS